MAGADLPVAGSHGGEETRVAPLAHLTFARMFPVMLVTMLVRYATEVHCSSQSQTLTNHFTTLYYHLELPYTLREMQRAGSQEAGAARGRAQPLRSAAEQEQHIGLDGLPPKLAFRQQRQ